MGAGQYGCGVGPCGADPVYVPQSPSPVVPPRAVKYDPSVKGFVLTDANGNAIDVHPVDQMVAVRWTWEEGVSASSPTVGQRIRARMAVSAPNKWLSIAVDEFNLAVADLVTAGDVKVLGVVQTVNPTNGAVVFVPSYVNLRDPNTDPRYPLANAQSLQP